MRFRTGLLIGLAVGYYYGSKAGHERYEQIEVWLDNIRDTTTYQDLRTKVNDGWREGTTAARRMIEQEARDGVTRRRGSPEASASDADDATSPTSWIRSGGSARA